MIKEKSVGDILLEARERHYNLLLDQYFVEKNKRLKEEYETSVKKAKKIQEESRLKIIENLEHRDMLNSIRAENLNILEDKRIEKLNKNHDEIKENNLRKLNMI